MPDSMIRYQSANISMEESISSFVVRTEIFEQVLGNIKQTKKGDSLQHYVFIGRRGSGKSTLLRRLEAEVCTKEELSKRFVVVNLSEEQAGIYKLHDLWDQVIIALEAKELPIKQVDWQKYQADLKEYTRQLYLHIHACLKETGKQLILLIDNIDRIFKSIGEDAHLFRELLMNYNEVRIIGGSTIMAEDFWSYDKPFYQYFSTIPLKSLTEEEVKKLLEFWSQKMNNPEISGFIKKHPGKLQTIRMLTDGTPRTMLLFVDLLINRPEQNGFEYLKSILDKATPIYQERLATLSPLQQKIVLELSFFWESVKIDELVPVCKMQSKTISAVMNQLTKLRIVEKIKGEGKNLLYRLSERFFNLWLLMTQGGPAQKQQVKYLTVFLENWYDREELKQVYQQFHENLTKGLLKPEYAASMTKALAHSKYITTEERDSLLESIQGLNEIKKEWLQELPEKASSILEKVQKAIEEGNYEIGINLLNTIEQENSKKNLFLARCYSSLKNFSDAEECYLSAAETGEKFALTELGILYDEFGKTEKSNHWFKKASENGEPYATVLLGINYLEQGLLEESEEWLIRAFNKGETKSMGLLGILYNRQGKLEESEQWLKKAVETGDEGAMGLLGTLYDELNRIDESEYWFKKAAASGNALAMNNLGVLYINQDRLEESMHWFKKGAELGDEKAMNNLAMLFDRRGELESAEWWLSQALKVGSIDAKYNLSNFYYNHNLNPSAAMELIQNSIQDHPGDIDFEILFPLICIWNGNIELFNEKVENVLLRIIENESADLSFYLINLIIHKQYNLVRNWFEGEKFGKRLKEKIQPIYYAVLTLQDEYDPSLLKVPPELMENLNDIVELIKKRQDFYYVT